MNEQDFGNSVDSFRSERSTGDLREDIKNQKAAIAGTIDQIDLRVHRAADWRAQVTDHPFIAIGAAFVAGGFVSRLFRHRPTPQERIMDAVAEGIEDITDSIRNRVVSQVTRGVSSSVLKVVGAALITRAASAFLTNQSIDEPENAGRGINKTKQENENGINNTREVSSV